jgi:replicative DNA helicase
VNALPSYFPPSPAPLPRNLEVEQGLLGALLDNSDVWTVVSASLQPEHFSEPLHARIYAAIVEMASHQGLVSPFVLKTKLESDPAFKDVGGFAYISGLIANALPRVTLESHSSLIRELADRRAVIASCETAMAEASDTGSGEFRRTISRHLDSLTSVLDGARGERQCHCTPESPPLRRTGLQRYPNWPQVSGHGHWRPSQGEYAVIGARPFCFRGLT